MGANNILIVGNSIAAISALKEIRKYDFHVPITILSKEVLDYQTPYYSPVALPYYIEGSLKKEVLFSKNIEFYKQHNAELKLGTEVKTLNPREKVVITTNNVSFYYDKLLIVTGASPRILNIPGAEKAYVLRTYNDAEKIKAITGEKIVIIGAGPVGIETALALLKLKKKITIIEVMPYILSTVFSKTVALQIETQLIKAGIEIIKEEKVIEITSSPSGVDTMHGFIEGDAVIMAVGVTPNTQFARDVLLLGGYHGIVVDNKMRTSIPDIYAAGDCIELYNIIDDKVAPVPVWPNAMETGTVAGANIIGLEKTYSGGIRLNALNVLDNVYFSIGLVRGDNKRLKIERDNITEYYNLTDGRIVGVEMVGNVKMGGIIKRAMVGKTTISDPYFSGSNKIYQDIILPTNL